ncbi:MAG: flagellar hook-length control protein FliK, partial [Planctomycetota bacterium]
SATGQAASANLIEDAPDEDNHRVTQQAIRAVRSVISQGGGSVTLRLNPQELGAIKVQLDLSNNTVRAQFTATNDAVRNILNQQMGTLRVALEGQGLQVESLSAQSPGSSTQTGADERDTEQTGDGRSRGTFTRQGSGDEQDDNGDKEPSEFQRELLDLVG